MFCMQYDCFITVSRYFTSFIYDFLILKIFVIFCNNLINVYCWQIYTCIFSAFLDRSFNNDHRYYDFFFLFCDEYISNLLTFFKRVNVRNARWYYDYHFIFKFFSFFSHHGQTILLFLDFLRAFYWQYVFV